MAATVQPAVFDGEFGTIYQGATYILDLQRGSYPYETYEKNGIAYKASDDTPAPESDRTPEDYTGCTADFVMRAEVGAAASILTGNTTDGRLSFPDGETLRIKIAHADTQTIAATVDWATAITHIYVLRPDGTRERQYEIRHTLSKST